MRQLPEAFQSLFDPEQPLPPEVQFFEEAASPNVLEAHPMIWYPCMVALIAVIVRLALGRELDSAAVAGQATAGLIAGWFIAPINAKPRAFKDQRAGKPTRFGLFLTSDDIL